MGHLVDSHVHQPSSRSSRTRRLAVPTITAALCLGATTVPAVTAAGSSRSPEAKPTSVTVRIGSFNIRSVQAEVNGLYGAEEPWKQRAPVVVSQILAEHPDVLGLQEASQATGSSLQSRFRYDADNQYRDLLRGLNEAGGSYAVTNNYLYNCVNPKTNVPCTYKNRGAGHDTRIFYNTKTVSMVRGGAYLFPSQNGKKNDKRYLAWAVFKTKSSGQRFFFGTTHLENGSKKIAGAEWRQLIKKVNKLHGSLPVIVDGDFQTAKFANPAKTMMTKMKANGYGDVVGQRPGVAKLAHPRAKKTVHRWINSMNSFDRNVADYAFTKNHALAGANCDWIFASNYLPVLRWKVVVPLNSAGDRVTGVMASDHFLVDADIRLVHH